LIYFFGFIFLLLAQRAFELKVARRHEKELKNRGGREVDTNGYRVIVGMHSAFFVSLTLEKVAFDRPLNPEWSILMAIFFAAQLLRYWAIHSLGIFWNTKIMIVPGHPIVRKGPYRYFRHPNYAAVITEFAVVPLIFSCYVTAVGFTIANALLLGRRIRIETSALASARP
jgi:methyltransferase